MLAGPHVGTQVPPTPPLPAAPSSEQGLAMFRLAAVIVVLGIAVPCRADAPVVIHPAALDLRHHRQPHALQVLGTTPDGYSLDLRPHARFASADPKVAVIDDHGWVRPVATGQT